MAKPLSITTRGGVESAPLANGRLKLSKSIEISKIEPHELFQSLFDIDEDLLGRIADSMKKDGFDPSQPIHIWSKTDDDGTSHSYLVDGYTRVAAAKKLGLETVPFYEHKFENIDEAHLYAIHLQVDRRNLTDGELIKNIEILMGSDYVKNMKGKTSEIIADVLGVSKRTVDKAINVIKTADEETKEKIDSGELTINKAYNKSHKKEESEDFDNMENSEENLDFSDTLSEDNSGVPQGMNFSHTDGIERPTTPPGGKLEAGNEADDRIANNRRIFLEGRKEGYLKGFSAGAYEIYDKMLEMIKSGKTADEIESDDLFTDFTWSEIAPKLKIEYVEE